MNLLRSASFQGWFLSVMAILFTAFGVYPKWEKALTAATISWDVSVCTSISLQHSSVTISGSWTSSLLFPQATYYPAPGFDQAFARESRKQGDEIFMRRAFAMLPGFWLLMRCLITESTSDGFSRPYGKHFPWAPS
ncbi:MAG: hypothetical protein IPJ06_14025 [Saprospiraceae bacterium]|nr:hypothetical protein [Saprospiraceae bacterium]